MTSVRESPAIHPGGVIEGSGESFPVVGGPVVAAGPVVRRVGMRAAALRRSRAAHQDREARRRLREVETEAVLADYYQAAQAAEEVMAAARARAAARAEQILTEAAKVAAGSQAAAVAALRRLRELGETRAGIRELTGLSAAQVREGLTPTPTASEDNEDAGTSVRADERDTDRSTIGRETTKGEATAGATAGRAATPARRGRGKSARPSGARLAARPERPETHSRQETIADARSIPDAEGGEVWSAPAVPDGWGAQPTLF